MPLTQGIGTTRNARTTTRKKVRLRQTKEAKWKAQVDAWVGVPTRNALTVQAQSLTDVSSTIISRQHESVREVKALSERVKHLETNMDRMVKEQVSVVMSTFRETNSQALLELEHRITEMSRVDPNLKDKFFEEQEKQKLEHSAFEKSANRRFEAIEAATKDVGETKSTLWELRVDFDEFHRGDSQREAYTQYLEAFVRDMEKRVWPWREHMDRSKSPPAEERMELWQPTEIQGAGIGWMPWPTHGPVKATALASSCPSTRPPSDAPTPCASVRPTPPTSRPSSAHQNRSMGNVSTQSWRPTPPSSRPSSASYRGRDPGRANQTSVAGSGSIAAKRVRPLSASSARSAR